MIWFFRFWNKNSISFAKELSKRWNVTDTIAMNRKDSCEKLDCAPARARNCQFLINFCFDLLWNRRKKFTHTSSIELITNESRRQNTTTLVSDVGWFKKSIEIQLALPVVQAQDQSKPSLRVSITIQKCRPFLGINTTHPSSLLQPLLLH